MSDQDRTTDQRPFPRFLDEWRELNGPDFTPSSYISQPGAIPFVIASQWLFCPNFIEYRGGVFTSDHTALPAEHRKILDDWFDYFKGGIPETESKGNLTIVPDLFSEDLEPYDEDLSVLAQAIAQCWRGLLKLQFPDREFVVEVFDDPEEPYYPQVTFYTKTEDQPPAPGAVVVYDLAPAQFAPVEGVPAAVHVDLPPSLRDEFAGLARPPARAQEVDVRAITSTNALLAAIAPGATTLTEALRQSPTTAILLSRFEQLWVKNRPVAEQFVRELPAALAAVRDAKPCHVALADLAGDTVGAVAELLGSASAETTEPVPVFRYAPSA